MKLIIAGGRKFRDFDKLINVCDYYLKNKSTNNIEIISGGADGVDRLGEKYAEKRNIRVVLFPAKWNVYGRKAGYLRNIEMAEYADALIAFWDGQSKGTKHMIDTAIKNGLDIRIFRYDK